MRRALQFLLHNWPLKLGAILLATVLYSGLVLAQNVRTWSGQLPVDAIRPPAGATLINELEPVTLIRYRAPIDVGVLSPDSFRATVDLSRVDALAGGPSVPVPITVIALDQRVQIVDFQPREEQIQLDPVEEREMPVTVKLGTVPDTISVGPPRVDPQTVTIRGASSRVDSVSNVVARVQIDASALNVDRDVDLVALDSNGSQVPSIEMDPPRVHVSVVVAPELATRTLPVVPQLIGAPAAGYRVTSVSIDPLVVTVSGEASVVSQLEHAATAPINIDGRTSDLEAEVGLDLPNGLSISGAANVRVMLTIARETGSATYGLGVTLTGTEPGVRYDLGQAQVNVTLGGAVSDLQALDATTLVATANVAGLGAGTHSLTLDFTPPEGLTLVSIDPSTMSVVVTPPAPSATGELLPTP